MRGKEASIKVHKPLIQQHCMVFLNIYALFASVDHNFLKLDPSCPKWQATSDAVRRLAHLGFLGKTKFDELTQIRGTCVMIQKSCSCLCDKATTKTFFSLILSL